MADFDFAAEAGSLCAWQIRIAKRSRVATTLGMRFFCYLAILVALPLWGAERPGPRSRAEVEAVLGKLGASQPPDSGRPLRVCLVACKKDHGPGEHDYPSWQTNWARLLSKAPGLTVTTGWKWPETFTNIDVAVFYYWNHDWSAEQYRQLDAFLGRGGGVVLLHSSTIADKDPEELAKRIGLSYQPGRSKYRHGSLDLKMVASTDEPITRGVPREIHFVDESYWPMFGDTNDVRVLATTLEEGKGWPMVWTRERGPSRVFATVLGHYGWTFDDPIFRIIVLRAIAWAGREPVTRLEFLATDGVALKE
ncbi:MAG: ThuA domain-containing protein [Verrucomicrobia subdivision 3 bacterium]|nr:ThuA domain-containing protein [Limisphaerales bacterium]